jgi:16S rRNA C1402 N4-methylase RsmH
MNYENIFQAICERAETMSDDAFASEYKLIEQSIPSAIIHRHDGLNRLIIQRVNNHFQAYRVKVNQEIPWYKFLSRYRAVRQWEYDGSLPIKHLVISLSLRK